MGFGNFLDIDLSDCWCISSCFSSISNTCASLSPLRCCWSSLHTSASVLFRYGGGGFALNCLVVQLDSKPVVGNHSPEFFFSCVKLICGRNGPRYLVSFLVYVINPLSSESQSQCNEKLKGILLAFTQNFVGQNVLTFQVLNQDSYL